MTKRNRGSSLKEDREIKLMCRDQCRSIDRISELPDKILVNVLSFLTVREAIATSVLSSRWRYLWISIHRLDFDGMELLVKVSFPKPNLEVLLNNGRSAYVGWVNHILALHKNSAIEEFRVFFNLNKSHESSIDEWLKYALARNVQRLELNLTDDVFYRNDECYTFPYKLLGRSSNSLQSRSMGKCEFKYIRKISLNYVNVDGEALKFFLCNCPLLEELSVSQSGELTTLKIIGPFPSFKRLEICLCHHLKSVEIRDTNLVCLKYRGKRIEFLLQNVPFLVEMFVGGILTLRVEDIPSMFSSTLSQLEIFKIDNLNKFPWMKTETVYSAVRMSNLKQLVVKVYLSDDDCLLQLTNLICAAPRLQKFTAEVWRSEPKFIKRSIRKIVSSYPHLKEVKFVGYSGVTSDLELIMHFLENSVSLEKIIIDPIQPCASTYHYMWNYNGAFKDKFIRDEMDARTRAKNQLTTEIVPPRITLEIL